MAVEYTLQTKLDLAVYFNALQRCAQNPLVIHTRRLNAVVRWAQRRPLTIVYKTMTPTNWLEVHSDAGFKREDDDADAPTGRSMRGADCIRLGRSVSGQEVCHLLGWHCGSIKAVTRSTFVPELQAAISATDGALPATPRQGM